METFIALNAKSKVGAKDRDNELSMPLPVIGMTYENHLNSINKDTYNENNNPEILVNYQQGGMIFVNGIIDRRLNAQQISEYLDKKYIKFPEKSTGFLGGGAQFEYTELGLQKLKNIGTDESKKSIIDSLAEGEFPSVPVKIGFDTYTLISIASITLMIVAIILIFKKYKK